MPPDRPSPGSAQDWLRYAVSDLQLAKTTVTPDVMLESFCLPRECAFLMMFSKPPF